MRRMLRERHTSPPSRPIWGGRPTNERRLTSSVLSACARSRRSLLILLHSHWSVSPAPGSGHRGFTASFTFSFCAVPKGLILKLGQILHRLKTNVPTIVDTQCGIWPCDSARRPVLSRFFFRLFHQCLWLCAFWDLSGGGGGFLPRGFSHCRLGGADLGESLGYETTEWLE